ncbi:uncharacterized protein LOC109862886, partial [Pseudomyrmex gracilis]|uniref:uncharacterized protein LOC109862886 n=1 Tax=Pseudomyrmex gracilis TaxID=219809 RepID=UPI0009951558
MVSLSGYQLHRCDRIGKGGGGVAFFAVNSLNVKILASSDGLYCRKPEFLFAEISAVQEKLLLAVAYRPPHCGHLQDFFNIRDVRTITVRDYSCFNWNHFLSELSDCDWNIFADLEEIDDKIAWFYGNLLNCYNKHAPLKTIHPKHLPAPWITPEIRTCMQERNKQRRRWRRNKTEASYSLYKRLRNQTQAMVREAKQNYYLSIFSNKKDPATIWSNLRQLGLVKSKRSDRSLLFSTEELNSFFLVDSNSSDLNGIYLGDESYEDEKFYWRNIDNNDVRQAIRGIKSNATGIDGLSLDMVVRALPCITPQIVLESLVARQITEYVETNNLLDPFQNAYRKNYSTQTALIRVIDDMRAFDCVNHQILVNKLKNLNFSCSALKWLCSYLFGRTQVVRDPTGGDYSKDLPVWCGVPQGSVLGPLLYTLYVSDFGKNLQFCKYNYYADDLLIYIHTKPTLFHEAITKVNLDICNVIEWATSNKLALNASKTSAMISGTRRYISNFVHDGLPRVVVDGVEIPYRDSVVYLGVTITSTLSWEHHVIRTVSR